MADAGDPQISTTLAIVAISVAELAESDDEVQAEVANAMLRLRISDFEAPSVLRAAAASISDLPQPLMETAEETERRRPVRQMLGLQSADEQLAAMLRARQLLEQMADRLEE